MHSGVIAAAWTPAALSSLLLDLDPAAITGVADGGNVTSLPDAGPNGYHAATLVGTAPTYAAADTLFGGKPAWCSPAAASCGRGTSRPPSVH